ncbi:MAG: TIM barrel protein [Angelakisella sp.]
MNEFNNYGIASYSFHGLKNIGAMDLFGYLETVKYRYNLNTADLWNGTLKCYDDDYLAIVKQNIDERGLTVVNLCCDNAHIWDNDPAVRQANEAVAWDCIKTARIIGAQSIRIDVGVREESVSEEQMDYIVPKYEEYCKAAAAFGARLGPENHWGGSQNYPSMERLFARVTAPNFALLLHLGNWQGTEEEKDRCDALFASRAMHIHLNYEHCAEADRILPPIKEAGYSGCWSVESHKSFNEYNNVAFQLAQVKRVISPLVYNGKWKVAPPSVVRGNTEA